MMTLPQLLHGMTEAEAPPLSVTQLSLDSRAIAPGAVFLACAGERAHGLQFAMRAAEAGAAAVLYDPVGADPDTLRAVQA
ncbi:MAG: Mur ligase domain-containing protein, partial [Oceanococcaceae bacterium]